MTETELPEGSQLQLVGQTTSTVTAQLEQLSAVSGDTDQQRRQQLLLEMLPVIQSAISRAVSEHAMKVQQEHEARGQHHAASGEQLLVADMRLLAPDPSGSPPAGRCQSTAIYAQPRHESRG